VQGRQLEAEAQIALACAQLPLSAASAKRAESLLRGHVDWDVLYDIVERHRISQRVYGYLLFQAASLVPPSELLRIADRFFSRAHRNSILSSELLRIQHALDDREIPAIPFKGPLLAVALYGSAVYRDYADLDVLVRRNDLPEAHRVLASIGYRLDDPFHRFPAAIHLSTEYAYPYHHAETGARLELHCELAPRYFAFGLKTDDVFARAVSMTWNGCEFRSFCEEDAALILSMHGAKHCWLWLDLICCLAAALRTTTTLDWAALLDRAASIGATRMVLVGLDISRELFDTALPGHVCDRIDRDRQVQRLRGEVLENLFRIPTPRATFIRSPWFHQAVRERLRDRVAYRVTGLMSPELDDLRVIALPKHLLWLYGLVRPIRVLGLYGRSLIRR
jgi:hypothetical protein